jgi:hypothetical protein
MASRKPAMAEKRLVKLVEKILRNPKDVDFDDLRRLLEGFGYTCRAPSSGSSHYTFRKSGCPHIITVPKDKPVNKTYVKQVIKLLDLEDWYENQNN